MKERVRISFGGVEFSGIKHGDRHITVPVPAFKKMLQAKRILPHLNYDIDDGNGQYDSFNQDIQKAAEWCERELGMMQRTRRPWLLYFDGQVIHYCPHSNLSYTLREVKDVQCT